MPPIAAFTVSPPSGDIPLAVSFADGSSGSPTSWLWDFGDGTTSTEQNPRHTYVSPGTYGVTLTVSDAYGSDTEIKAKYLSVQQNCGDYNADGYVNKDDFIKRRDYLTYQMETIRQEFVDWFFQCWLPNQRSTRIYEDDPNKAMQEALDYADEKAKEAVDHAEELFQE